MKNKKLVLIIIVFILLLCGSLIGYKYLVSNYKGQDIINKDNGNSDNDSTINPDSKEKKLAEDFTVYDKNGNEVKLSDFKGTPIVLNFWASWCPPCKYEMPFFQNASNNYKNNEVIILMVNLTDGERETEESASKYVEDNKYTMNVLFDKVGDTVSKYQLYSIPKTVFIDKDGYIVNVHDGMIDEEQLSNNILNLINN